jgi:hypothetical protein
MMLHSATPGIRGTVIDLDTGRPVPGRVIWLDLDKGELEAYRWNQASGYLCDVNGNYLTYRARGRFRYLPAAAPAPAIRLGAPHCVKCRNPLTLPGDDLCPACNAKDRGYKGIGQAPDLSGRCCYAGCSRSATWQVADEVEATPVLGKGTMPRSRRSGIILYPRAATVACRAYCDFHFQLPRLLDARGEVIKQFEDGLTPDGRSR